MTYITSAGYSVTSECIEGPEQRHWLMAPARSMPKEISELSAELDRFASRVTLRKGTALFHCGDPLSGVFIVRRGKVTMSVDGDHPVYPPRTLGPGEIAGLPATLTGHYSLTARVSEDSELGFVPGPKVSEVLECSPRLCMMAMRLMSDEIGRVRAALRETPHLHEIGDEPATPALE